MLIDLLVSQCTPVHPGSQLQLYPLISSRHVPPCSQGPLAHSSISETNKYGILSKVDYLLYFWYIISSIHVPPCSQGLLAYSSKSETPNMKFYLKLTNYHISEIFFLLQVDLGVIQKMFHYVISFLTAQICNSLEYIRIPYTMFLTLTALIASKVTKRA